MHIKNDFRFQPKGLKSKLGWYSRGYLPHFDGGELPQFITMRLFDSLPASVIAKWRQQLQNAGEDGKLILRRKIEVFLDRAHGECFLADDRVAVMLQNALLFLDGKKYRMLAWVIMPNHLHLLVVPMNGVELRKITHSIKSYTAHEANKILGRSGQFWQHESFDRYIRNERHLFSTIRYIEGNPVKAYLCSKPEDWQFSSAHYRRSSS